MKYLATVPGLEELNLEATDISDAATDSLARIRAQRLNLSFTGVSIAGGAFGAARQSAPAHLAGARLRDLASDIERLEAA